MYKFKHKFRKIEVDDHDVLEAFSLPNGEDPMTYTVSNAEENVEFSITGSGCGDTIFSITYEGETNILVFPRFNRAHVIIADAIVDYLECSLNDLKSGVAKIIEDFQMV